MVALKKWFFRSQKFLISLVALFLLAFIVTAGDVVVESGTLNVDNMRITGLSNCDTIDTDGTGVLSCGSDETGGGGIPSGAVMFFNLGSCPVGWSPLVGAQGRYIVGLPSGGTLAGTQGAALSNRENREVGRHNHGISDSGHKHYGSEVDEYDEIMYIDDSATGSNDYTPSGGSVDIDARPGMGKSTTGISINYAGSVSGTNAPYIQFLVCQKD